MMFKLDNYFNKSKYVYVFADVTMSQHKEHKETFLKQLGICYDSFRAEKSREAVKNDNVKIILKYYNINPVNPKDKSKYEKCINNIYYAIYYCEVDSVIKYIEELDVYIAENNFLKPLFVLFKVFAKMNIGESIASIKKDSIEYIRNFKRKYFIDEFEIINESVLISFDYKIDLTKLMNLGLAYKKLNWIHLSTKASVFTVKEKENNALRCYSILNDEYRIKGNLKRWMINHVNMCFCNNLLEEYDECIQLTKESIDIIYSGCKSNVINDLLMHYLFSNFMLNRYEDIISLYQEKIFDLSKLNWVSACICIVASFFNNTLDKASIIENLFIEDKNIMTILEFIKTGDKNLLLNIDETPYIKMIIKKLRKH